MLSYGTIPASYRQLDWPNYTGYFVSVFQKLGLNSYCKSDAKLTEQILLSMAKISTSSESGEEAASQFEKEYSDQVNAWKELQDLCDELRVQITGEASGLQLVAETRKLIQDADKFKSFCKKAAVLRGTLREVIKVLGKLREPPKKVSNQL